MNSAAASHGEAFVSAGAIEATDLGNGIRRKILGHGPDLMVARVWFETGAVGDVHSHPHSQSTYVEIGRFEVSVGGTTGVLSAGDGFYVAPHVAHGVICLEQGVLIDTFSPARQDFLREEKP